MKPTVILVPGGSPKASESIFQAIRQAFSESGHDVLVLEKASWRDLESKAAGIASKILLGKSAGGRLVVEYQIKHRDSKALVLLSAAIKASEQVAEISIPILVVHGTADRIVPIENSRELAKQFKNSRLVEVQGVDHNYRGKEQETAQMIVKWINEVIK